MPILGAQAAQASTVTAIIGCSSSSVPVYWTSNASGLPRSTTLRIKIERWGTGSAHHVEYRNQATNSSCSISLPTYYGENLSTTDFGTEWVSFTYFSGPNIVGSGSASHSTCSTGGGGWGPPKDRVSTATAGRA